MENSLESLDNLTKLAVLKNLQELDLTGNPVASQPNYRPFLFDKYFLTYQVSKALKF